MLGRITTAIWFAVAAVVTAGCKSESSYSTIAFVVDPGCEARLERFLSDGNGQQFPAVRVVENARGYGLFHQVEKIVLLSVPRGGEQLVDGFVNGALSGCGFTTHSNYDLNDPSQVQTLLFLLSNSPAGRDSYIRVNGSQLSVFSREP